MPTAQRVSMRTPIRKPTTRSNGNRRQCDTTRYVSERVNMCDIRLLQIIRRDKAVIVQQHTRIVHIQRFGIRYTPDRPHNAVDRTKSSTVRGTQKQAVVCLFKGRRNYSCIQRNTTVAHGRH